MDSSSETPPAWLLERHGTLEQALLDADLAVIRAEADIGAVHRDLLAAMDRKVAAEEDFNVAWALSWAVQRIMARAR